MKPSDHQHQIPERRVYFHAFIGAPRVLEKLAKNPKWLWAYTNHCRAVIIHRQRLDIQDGIPQLREMVLANYNDFEVYRPAAWRRWCDALVKEELFYARLPHPLEFLSCIYENRSPKKLFRELGPCRIRYSLNRTNDLYVLYEQQGTPCLRKISPPQKPPSKPSNDSTESMEIGFEFPFSYMKAKVLWRP